jgi:hypothetical protein
MPLPDQGNLLLRSLRPDVVAALRPEVMHLAPRTMLFTQDRIPEFIYFPHAGSVASMVRSTSEGITVESGVVGSEGVLSVQTIIAAPVPSENEGMVQVPGDFSRIRMSVAREHFQKERAFRDPVLRFTNALLIQITQNLICNRLHLIQQRLAKWLLVVRDRTLSDDLAITHEFLAHMLGTHRPGVSAALSELAQDGLIRPRRGVVTLLDPAGLQARACECRATLLAALETLQSGLSASGQSCGSKLFENASSLSLSGR